MGQARSGEDVSGITPFWKKFGTFLAAPLHPGPIMLLGLVALGGIVAGLVGQFALILRTIVVFAAIRFAFQLFDHFSSGRFNVNSPDIVSWPPHDPRAVKQGLVILFYVGLLMGIAYLALPSPPAPVPREAAGAAMQWPDEAAEEASATPPDTADDEEWALRQEGGEEAQPDYETESPADDPWADPPAEPEDIAGPVPDPGGQAPADELPLPRWFWLVAVLLAVPLPASAAMLALEDRLIRALNPMHALTFLRAMGGGYFVLLGLFLGIFLVREGIALFARELPAVVHYPVEGVAIAYFTIVLYAMLGYVVYQYHDELGLTVAVDFEAQKAAQAPEELDPLERKIRPLLAEGNIDRAIDWVKDEMRYDRLDVDLNRRLHELYLLKGDHGQTLAHGQQYLNALIAKHRGDEALKLLFKLEELDPDFAPVNGDAIHPLAVTAYGRQHFQKALSLLKGFDRLHPEHPHIPDVYLLWAKLSSEFLRKDFHSVAILKTLLKRYPEAACVAEAKVYLAALENIANLTKQPGG